MPRWLIAGLCAACGAACVPVDYDSARDVIGVSAARTASGDQTPGDVATGLLAWKAGQICTNGYDLVRRDLEPAEDDQQLIDWQVRCAAYTHASLF